MPAPVSPNDRTTLLDRIASNGRPLRELVAHVGRGRFRHECAVCLDAGCEFCPAVRAQERAA